ncbi:hypothetical protein [Mycobacterium tilburgii]|uniref:hypothetical protein n=1 Tax=Mycobacterium tilburgii TaxID=44467 RepID=UPI001642F13D|nr:hypothetical protein [Mycobacterium tilburgii]
MLNAGATERQAAEEIIRMQVMPHVDNDIRGNWGGRDAVVVGRVRDGVRTW